MKVRLKLVEGVSFVAHADSGHAVVMDGSPEIGGQNLGVRPMEMLLMGLGGCTALDVVSILRKARQAVRDCVVEVAAERSDQIPRVFTRIHVRFVVTGSGLSESHVRRAVDLSADKYCSASIMLGKTAEISHSFEIIETDGSGERKAHTQ